MELTQNTMSKSWSMDLDIIFSEPYLSRNMTERIPDCLEGAFPDYYLPVPGNVQVSQAFLDNTGLIH